MVKKPKDYYAIYFMGITFVGVGVVFLTTVNQGLGAAFIAIGGLYMIIGGKNKDSWPKKERKQKKRKRKK